MRACVCARVCVCMGECMYEHMTYMHLYDFFTAVAIFNRVWPGLPYPLSPHLVVCVQATYSFTHCANGHVGQDKCSL